MNQSTIQLLFLSLISMIILSAFVGLINPDIKKLETAYKHQSAAELEKFILKNARAGKVKPNTLAADASKVVDAFLEVYSGNKPMSAALFDRDNMPTAEKFILVQPTVQTGITDHLDSLSIFGIPPNPTDFWDQPLYPHKGAIGAFASVGYVNFDKLQSVSLQKLSLSQQGKYAVALVDTNFIKIVQQFLPKKGIENYKRANFLKSALKLYKHMYGEEDKAIGQYPLRYFNYNFYIDQLVFDKERKQAIMQYAYYRSSHQAYFKKSGKEWKLIQSRACVWMD